MRHSPARPLWAAVLTLSAFGAGLASAQNVVEARSQKIEAALQEWANENKIEQYSLAVGYEGKIVHRAAKAQANGDSAPLASLSKAVTGACVMALESAGLLDRNDRLGKILGDEHALISGNSKSRVITITQLLTHTSGLRPDTTQGRIHNWKFARSNRIGKRAREGLANDANKGKAGAFFYNNSNYFILGAVIEHVTGKPYEKACPDVLPYLREMPTLRVSEKWLAIAPIGGWEASSADYLSFVMKSYGPGSGVQQNEWSLPAADIGRGAFYGPGVLYRKNRTRGHNVWHTGLLCNPDKKDDHGSFFAIWGTTWSVAVTFNKCTTFKQLIKLDQSLAKAALR